MKAAIVTALCGNREALVNPTVVLPNVDYIAFVDQKWPNATVWDQRPLEKISDDPKYANRRNAKIYKVAPHRFLPEHDMWIWADVSHDCVVDPELIADTFLRTSDIGLFRHNQRDCLYKEAALLKELQYDHPHLIDKQISAYRMEAYPEHNGLWELPVSVRKNTESIRALNELWWNQIENYSSRDQLSMPFCLWKLHILPTTLPGFANGNGGYNANPIIPQKRPHVSSGG